MLLPQIEENDIYDISGQQKDDINSLLEFSSVYFGLDKLADDEDDDNGNELQIIKVVDCYSQKQSVLLEDPIFTTLKTCIYKEYKASAPFSPSYDIISPPPEA